MTIQARSMFLGGTDKLLQLMEEKFPQLGLVKEDCLEMSWAQSDLYFEQFPIGAPLETLLGRNHKSALSKSFFKEKSDFVKQPIPEMVVAQVLRGRSKSTAMAFVAYGGQMNEIPETETPHPHRAGNIFIILYMVD
ncbi:hypothetical protein PVK06_045961 [Gossypium arboreum]|uniref:Uncharacterized protein n=1 Tax=Gossypium arboreum TaxID=29729 RepID=A0ABR0MY27_GOSAR|nr:hypothetical protein PVK06_045961 [Gossypium arboreum]